MNNLQTDINNSFDGKDSGIQTFTLQFVLHLSALICQTLQRWAELTVEADRTAPLSLQGHVICCSGR